MNQTHAAFILTTLPGGQVAATTRAADRGEAGRIGLPGGKLEAGETAREAAIREAAEEGWLVSGVDPAPFHRQLVDGRPVVWFRAAHAVRLDGHKEAGRITPASATLAAIAASGYGNDAAVAAFPDTDCPTCAAVGGYCGGC